MLIKLDNIIKNNLKKIIMDFLLDLLVLEKLVPELMLDVLLQLEI
jgi:hypothetical protein